MIRIVESENSRKMRIKRLRESNVLKDSLKNILMNGGEKENIDEVIDILVGDFIDDEDQEMADMANDVINILNNMKSNNLYHYTTDSFPSYDDNVIDNYYDAFNLLLKKDFYSRATIDVDSAIMKAQVPGGDIILGMGEDADSDMIYDYASFVMNDKTRKALIRYIDKKL